MPFLKKRSGLVEPDLLCVNAFAIRIKGTVLPDIDNMYPRRQNRCGRLYQANVPDQNLVNLLNILYPYSG
jgi:hypothetical protein